MAERSAIEWTATRHKDGTVTPGATINPIRGQGGGWTCEKVSPACAHCYAERLNLSYMGNGKPYLPGKHAAPVFDYRPLEQAIKWQRPRKVFVCSMTDLFWEAVPDGWIDRVYGAMVLSPQHTYMVLTKRAARMAEWYANPRRPLLVEAAAISVRNTMGGSHRAPKWQMAWPLPNVRVGVTAENQRMVAARVPKLIEVPAACRFVSAEPLLGPIDLSPWLQNGGADLHWVITGGESGGPDNRRLVERVRGRWLPTYGCSEWVRSVRDQCQDAGIAFFHKAWGGPTPKSGGRLLDGAEWSGQPLHGIDGPSYHANGKIRHAIQGPGGTPAEVTRVQPPLPLGEPR